MGVKSSRIPCGQYCRYASFATPRSQHAGQWYSRPLPPYTEDGQVYSSGSVTIVDVQGNFGGLPSTIAAESRSFAVREKASQRLAALGEAARPALRKAQARPRSLEVARRVETLLARLKSSKGASQGLGKGRAIEVLEHIGTAEARRALEALVMQDDEPSLVREAEAALLRLRRRKGEPRP
jgi:hypothetical protein